MTLSARLEDMEVTLEHMLMDVFVSWPTFNSPSIVFSAPIINNKALVFHTVKMYPSLPFMTAVSEQGPAYVHIYFQMFCH